MKKMVSLLATLLMVAIFMATSVPATEREVTADATISETPSNVEGKMYFMCIKPDGYTVTVVLRPEKKGWHASVIDGSPEIMELSGVTSVSPTEEGIKIEWSGSTMTILGATLCEIIPN